MNKASRKPSAHSVPERVQARLPADVEAKVRAAIKAAHRGETMALTSQEAERYYETGELPDRIERWAASQK